MRFVIISSETTFSQQAEGDKIVVKADTPYIMPDYMAEQLLNAEKDKKVNNFVKKNKDIYNEFKKYNNYDLNNKTLLILRTGGFGDLIFLTPMARYLKNKYPSSRIILICGSRFTGLFDKLSCFDKVFPMPVDLRELSKFLGYSASNANTYAISFEGLVENNPKAKQMNIYDLHREEFGLPMFEYQPEIYVDKDIEELVNNLYFSKNKTALNIAFQVTASSPIRSWKPKSIIDFFNTWAIPNTTFYLIDSPAKYGYVQKMLADINNSNIEFVIQRPDVTDSLQRAVSMIKGCDLIFGPDSAIMHLAACFNKPMIGLFGAFPSELRLKYYKNAIGIDAMPECPYALEPFKSCFDHGHNCRVALDFNRSFSPCMDLITAPLVLANTYTVLKKMKLIEQIGDKLEFRNLK